MKNDNDTTTEASQKLSLLMRKSDRMEMLLSGSSSLAAAGLVDGCEVHLHRGADI